MHVYANTTDKDTVPLVLQSLPYGSGCIVDSVHFATAAAPVFAQAQKAT